jgi:hypothetical protein
LSRGSGNLHRVQHEWHALGQIADAGEVVLEVRGFTVRRHGGVVSVKLVENEAIRIGLVQPQIISQIPRLGSGRRCHAEQQCLQVFGLACAGGQDRHDLYRIGHCHSFSASGVRRDTVIAYSLRMY